VTLPRPGVEFQEGDTFLRGAPGRGDETRDRAQFLLALGQRLFHLLDVRHVAGDVEHSVALPRYIGAQC
jgi:hypothetical protein